MMVMMIGIFRYTVIVVYNHNSSNRAVYVSVSIYEEEEAAAEEDEHAVLVVILGNYT